MKATTDEETGYLSLHQAVRRVLAIARNYSSSLRGVKAGKEAAARLSVYESIAQLLQDPFNNSYEEVSLVEHNRQLRIQLSKLKFSAALHQELRTDMEKELKEITEKYKRLSSEYASHTNRFDALYGFVMRLAIRAGYQGALPESTYDMKAFGVFDEWFFKRVSNDPFFNMPSTEHLSYFDAVMNIMAAEKDGIRVCYQSSEKRYLCRGFDMSGAYSGVMLFAGHALGPVGITEKDLRSYWSLCPMPSGVKQLRDLLFDAANKKAEEGAASVVGEPAELPKPTSKRTSARKPGKSST